MGTQGKNKHGDPIFCSVWIYYIWLARNYMNIIFKGITLIGFVGVWLT